MRCILEVMKSNFSTENLQDFSQPLADPSKAQDADVMLSQLLRPPVIFFGKTLKLVVGPFGISPRGRTASSNRPMAYSTTDSVLAFGVFTTVMPRPAQCFEIDVIHAHSGTTDATQLGHEIQQNPVHSVAVRTTTASTSALGPSTSVSVSESRSGKTDEWDHTNGGGVSTLMRP